MGPIKKMLKKYEVPYPALLSYHITTLHITYSPSELSHTLRSTVPSTKGQRIPKISDRETVKSLDKEYTVQMKVNFNSHHGARPLPHLSSRDTVWIYEVDTSNETYNRRYDPTPQHSHYLHRTRLRPHPKNYNTVAGCRNPHKGLTRAGYPEL